MRTRVTMIRVSSHTCTSSKDQGEEKGMFYFRRGIRAKDGQGLPALDLFTLAITDRDYRTLILPCGNCRQNFEQKTAFLLWETAQGLGKALCSAVFAWQGGEEVNRVSGIKLRQLLLAFPWTFTMA